MNTSIQSPSRQLRFKDKFYGHSEKAAVDAKDAVAEWLALQNATLPVRLADQMTWLRQMGITEEPQLLTTVADRPPGFNYLLP